MDGLTFALVAGHLLSAVFWVGGTIFLALVGPPVRASGDAVAKESLRAAGLRFRVASWVAVLVLMGTGLAMVARAGAFADIGAFASARPALVVKVCLVAAMVAVKASHDFVVGPRAARLARAPEGSAGGTGVWRAAMVLGHANALLGAVVVCLAVLVAEGG